MTKSVVILLFFCFPDIEEASGGRLAVDAGISNIMHELINNACASTGYYNITLLYSVNSFWRLLKQIA